MITEEYKKTLLSFSPHHLWPETWPALSTSLSDQKKKWRYDDSEMPTLARLQT